MHIATIHKNVLPPAVAVEVAEYLQVTLSFKRMAQLLGRIDRRMQHFTGPLPTAVQITSGQTAAVVAVDDAIRVEHWHDFEDEVLTQVFCLERVRINKEV